MFWDFLPGGFAVAGGCIGSHINDIVSMSVVLFVRPFGFGCQSLVTKPTLADTTTTNVNTAATTAN